MNSSWARALITCFEKGARAFFEGQLPVTCPYRGRCGVNAQRRDYWHQGFQSAKSGHSVLDECGEIRDRR